MKSNKNNQIDKRLDKPMIPNPKLLEDLLYTENDIKDLNYEKDLGWNKNLSNFLRMLNVSIPHKSFDDINSDVLLMINQERKL